MIYGISLSVAALLTALMLFLKRTKKENIICTRIIPCLLMVIFTVRLFCYQEQITKYIGLDSSPLSKGITVLTLLAIWFEYAIIIIIMMRPFFNIKLINDIVKYLSIPILLLNVILLGQVLTLLENSSSISVLSIVLPVEIGFGLAISIYYLINDWKKRSTLKEIGKMVGVFLLMLIPTLPGYLFQFMFGDVKRYILLLDLTFAHRMLLYFSLIIPVVLYYCFRKRSNDAIRYMLIYVSLGVLVGFLVNFNYQNLTQPWTWPFHLCNTALFILPLVIIFRMKRLFYFTYFINVVGALFAMLMPNYADATDLFSLRIFTFWFNHYAAFFMPLLAVALRQFERPKIKQFYYSMVGFLFYYILVLVLNVVFTALGHTVDYFFINSDHIVSILGQWAENLFDITTSFSINNYQFVFRPPYQILFFVVYIGIGFATWFVYEEGFAIFASLDDLNVRLKKIRLDKFALEANLGGRSIEEPMNKDAGIKYELKHFSKKYGNNKVYAVYDANLEVFGGEIFGFLGPNGAGKSTIIKSTVGIQPITEGTIEINGYDVRTQPVQAKRNIGYVPDHYALYEKLTGREYVNYIADIYDVSLEERNERIEKYITLFELEEAIDRKINTYSHGMKQKITIMAALVHNPKIWILDEPLTGLDPNSIFQVKECMREHAANGNIVFFSSHIIDIVEKLCERIAIIKKGKIRCIKTIKEIEDSGYSLEQFYLEVISKDDKEEA